MRSIPFLLLLLSFSCSRPEAPSAPQRPFTEHAAAAGLDFIHSNGASGRFLLPEIMGAGVALLDYDRDGDLDVYLVQSGSLESASNPPNRLFRNELVPSGRLRFTDVTATAGVGHIGYGMGAAVGDFDNDGYPDLYLTNFGPNVLYRNNGNGTFSDVTRAAGVDDPRWSSSAAFVDYDRDGRLDLFVANYLDYAVARNIPCSAPTGQLDYCNPTSYKGLPSRLFRNEGAGRFSDVTVSSGIGAVPGKGLGVVCFDQDRDGWIDIYVANDGVPNHLWRNRQGRFTEEALLAGVAFSAEGKAQAGMGVDAADLDNSGRDSLFVTNLALETNNLYRPDPSGNFEDAILSSGMGPASLMMTGFGVRFLDFDHDGALDLMVANGAVTTIDAQRGSPAPFRQPSQLFRSAAGRFAEVMRLQPEDVSRGLAVGDIDNDGDLDAIIANNNGPVRLWRNDAPAKGTSLTVELTGVIANRQALGARVGLLRPGQPTLWRRAQTDGSYLSASDSRVHFGFPPSPAPSEILVEWPGAAPESFPAPPSGRLQLRQGTGRPR
jgi:enediyne biosynthesis protein E4